MHKRRMTGEAQRAEIELSANRKATHVLKAQIDGHGRGVVQDAFYRQQRGTGGAFVGPGQLERLEGCGQDSGNGLARGVRDKEEIVVQGPVQLAQLVLDRAADLALGRVAEMGLPE